MVSTQAAWHEGNEVVEVTYRPDRISFAELLESAEQSDCTAQVYTTTEAQLKTARAAVGERALPLAGAVRRSKDADQLYYLRKSSLRHLPLTSLQAVRVNSALGLGQDPYQWLSPRQSTLATEVERKTAELEGLERPTAPLELGAYELELRRRL